VSTVTRAASRRMGGAADQAVRPYEVAIAATSGAELLPHGRGARSAPINDATPRVWAGLALVAASSPMTRR
jgi:hypothetical protein